MTIQFATFFPYNNGDVAPTIATATVAPGSLASDIADVNLRRKLVTNYVATAAKPKATIEAAADSPVNFVAVIGPDVAGAAVVEVLPDTGTKLNGTDTALTLVKGGAAFKLFPSTFATARKVSVEFPSVNQLECGLILAGELKEVQAVPQSVRTQKMDWRPEQRPRDVQLPSKKRGRYRMINLIYTSLTRVERDELSALYDGANDYLSIVVNNTNLSDPPVYGLIDGNLDLTDRRFSDYSDARLSVRELVPVEDA